MRGKSPATFARRMVRANARRQALSNLSGQASASLPLGIDTPAAAELEIRIEPFHPAGGPVIDLKPEEIEIRVGGVAVTIESFSRVAVGQAVPHSSASGPRNTVALLDEEDTRRNPRAEERRQRVVELVAGAPEARSAQEAIGLKLLAGRVIGRADADSWRMRFEPSWPAALASRGRDLYQVMLSPAGEVLVFEERRGTMAEEREGLEMSLEGEGERTWGIFAVDPETGKGWIRCLKLKIPR